MKTLRLNLPVWRDRLSGIGVSERHKRFLVRALLMALGVRIGLLLAGYITGYVLIDNEGASVWDVIVETFNRWDANNFQRVAEVGYVSEGHDRLFIVFLPGYPATIWLFHLFIPNYFIAAMVAATVAAVAAGFLIQVLIAKDGGDEGEVERGLWYMTLFPTAYFLAMPYSESMFLALVLGSFVAARNERWAWCGALGMLATATRIQGLALIPALAVEAFHRYRWQSPLRAYWLVLVPVGFLTYLGINWAVFGDPFEFMDIEREHWFHERIWPWEGVKDTLSAIQDLPSGFTRTSIYEFRLASMVLTAWLLLVAVRWLRPSYQVYAWVTLIFMMSVSWQISLPRYLLGIFPIFLVMAHLSRSPGVHQVLLTSSAILMGSLYVVYAKSWGF